VAAYLGEIGNLHEVEQWKSNEPARGPPAIALSRRCMIDNGSAPFAALIVKDGAVVGEGVNNVINN
jgi:tRNA(Arg) A34 adenosine deaminase TadA